jgi:hypothetical protein
MCSKAEAVVDHGEVAGGQFETMAIGVGNHLTAGRRSWSRLGLAASGVEPDTISSCAFATRKQDVLRFPIDPRVPFTNNEAERDGRIMKVKTEGLQWLPQPRGGYELRDHPVSIGTAPKQGWNVIQVLSQTSKTLAAKLQAG